MSRCIPTARWRGRPARPPSSAAARREEKSFEVPSTVGGLAFAPKGLRLAIAHYNGVTLWFPNMAANAEFLEWAGSHLGVIFSPDNKFLVTAMHEPALHGWRLADNRHMRMTGYPGRVRSMSWSAGGKALATSGADTVIMWPFASKDGPMGKEPAMLAPLQARVSAVACHPKQDILAAGYSDGTILMVRLTDGAEILVRRNGGAAVAALAWNAKGTLLALPPRTATRGCWSCSAAACRIRGNNAFARPLISRTNRRVNAMSPDNGKRTYRQDLLLATAMVDGGGGHIRLVADPSSRPRRSAQWRRRRRHCNRHRVRRPGRRRPRAGDNRCTANRNRTGTRPPRRRGAKGGRDAGTAGRAGRKDGAADQGPLMSLQT